MEGHPVTTEKSPGTVRDRHEHRTNPVQACAHRRPHRTDCLAVESAAESVFEGRSSCQADGAIAPAAELPACIAAHDTADGARAAAGGLPTRAPSRPSAH